MRHGLPAAGEDDGTGSALRTLAGRPAAICTFLPGVWPRRVRPEHCAPLRRRPGPAARGRARASPTRSAPMASAPQAWAPLLERCRAGGDGVQAGLIAELDSGAWRRSSAAWPARGCACRPGRSMPTCSPTTSSSSTAPDGRAGGCPGIIDFYFACTDLLAYDIAVCLNAWCFEPDGSYNVTKAHALLAAYQRLRPLDTAERAALPVLCRGAALRFLLTRLYDWMMTPAGALVTRKDPLEYTARPERPPLPRTRRTAGADPNGTAPAAGRVADPGLPVRHAGPVRIVPEGPVSEVPEPPGVLRGRTAGRRRRRRPARLHLDEREPADGPPPRTDARHAAQRAERRPALAGRRAWRASSNCRRTTTASTRRTWRCCAAGRSSRTWPGWRNSGR